MKLFDKKTIRDLMKQGKLKDAKDISTLLKEQFADIIEEMLEAELDEELGYTKYDYKNKETTNSRNGKRKKTVMSEYGELDIDVPRDRYSEFEPVVVKKNQTDISGIEDQILGMYAKGMTVRDIQDHIDNIYGFEASPALISRITDKILPLVGEWQNRPLESIYCHVIMDAVHYKVRQEGRIINKAAYVAIGTNLDGMKEVLGIWVGENESSKYWLKVITELKNRGVEDILIASIDGLAGFSDAIKAVFPETEVQRCIIHQIRNSTKYLSYKDRKSFCNDLKNVYQASTESEALQQLDLLEDKWGDRYLIAVKSWRNNWDEISAFFKYPPEIRKMIYTTNAIESYNRQLRKVTKSKSVFPTDESLMKMLYLATMDIQKKWTQRYRGWSMILAQLSIHFEDRLQGYDY